MNTGRAWQVVVDCDACLTEGATTEIHTEGCVLGSSCQVCLRTVEAGELVEPGLDMTDATVAREALHDWASREGLEIGELARGVVGLELAEILARYARREPVPTSLDVLAFLFPGSTAGGSPTNVPIAPTPAPTVRSAVPADPRAPARVLASIMVADGTLGAAERRFVDAFLVEHGMEPLEPAEIRPWRPHELGPVHDRDLAEATLEAAVELVHLDGVRDRSELRVLHTFARVWGVDASRIDTWDRHYDRHHAPPFRTVWRALSRWVR